MCGCFGVFGCPLPVVLVFLCTSHPDIQARVLIVRVHLCAGLLLPKQGRRVGFEKDARPLKRTGMACCKGMADCLSMQRQLWQDRVDKLIRLLGTAMCGHH